MPPTGTPRRPTRHSNRWCAVGVVILPLLQAFVWSQYNHIVSADEAVLVGGDLCDCQATVSRWVNDYFWTQMIWLPANTLVLLIWGALAFRLWGRHFGPRRLT